MAGQTKVLGGRYRVLERIGEGGMAFVYVAIDEKLGRKVAIKVLHEHLAQNAEIRKRFHMEARAISGLDHPNIIKIYDFSGSQSDDLWIVTEMVQGSNLSQFSDRFSGHRLNPILSSCIIREICKALERAHNKGIVHRDVKPENVMVTETGQVKLMDFGIAKDLQRSSMTVTGTFMGSPSYMSPEQIKGKDIDHRTDVYSLGILFYESISGRLPYIGNTTHDIVLKIMEGQFNPPHFIVPSLSGLLDSIIIKAMAKDPGIRFQSAALMGIELDGFLSINGFEESHIELERYFTDRKGFDARVQAGSNQPRATTEESRRRKSRGERQPAAVTRDQGERRVSVSRRPATSPQPLAATTRQQQQHRQSQATPGKSVYRSAESLAANVHGGGRGQSLRRAGQTISRILRRSVANPPVLIGTSLLGFVVIGVIAAFGIWGFWKFQQTLPESIRHDRVALPVPPNAEPPVRNNPVAPVKDVSPALGEPHPAIAPIVPDVPVGPVAPPIARPIVAVVKPIQATAKEIVRPKKPLAVATRVVPQRTSVAPIFVASRAPAKPVQPGVTSVAVKQPSRPAAIGTSRTSTPESIAPKSPSDTNATVAFSSQPASEIYIDHQRKGTTVDKTSQSAWLSVAPGEHLFELRRRGYKSYSRSMTMRPGERKMLSGIRLIPLAADDRESATNTLFSIKFDIDPLPATATVEEVASGSRLQVQIREPWQGIQLLPGRYRITVTHRGQSRSRELSLPGSSGDLTFSATFKGGGQ